MRPEHTPIGLQLTRTARLVGRAFDEALVAAGGSLPVWLILLNLKIRTVAKQRELAEAVGVSAPTLTHHLNAMEADGLLARRRDPAHRRNHLIELTEPGDEAFARLRAAALAFDARLRAGFRQRSCSHWAQSSIGCARTSPRLGAALLGRDSSSAPPGSRRRPLADVPPILDPTQLPLSADRNNGGETCLQR